MSDQEASSTRKLLQGMREKGKNFDLYSTREVTGLYADGIANVQVGPTVSRLEFFTISDITRTSEGEVLENRELHLRVVLPTLQLVEALTSVLGTIAANPNLILTALDQNKDAVIKMLSTLKVSNVSQPP